MSPAKNRSALVLLYVLLFGSTYMVVTTGDGAFIPAILFLLAQLVFISVMFRGWRALERTGRAFSAILLLVFPLSLIVVFSAVSAFPKLARESGHEVSGGAFTLYALSFVVLAVCGLGAGTMEQLRAVGGLGVAACVLLIFVTQLIVVGRVAAVHTAAWTERNAPKG